MSVEQCRGARGMLGWSQAKLADHANVSLSTVRDFEKGRHLPHRRNMLTLINVMEGAGIEFLPENGEGDGVRYNRPRE
ncbi:MAG: helix-turn-helix domain-containing protein [Hyphomicrobiales bacterium]